MKNIISFCAVGFIFIVSSLNTFAGILDKALPILAPGTKTTINIIKGDKPEDAVKKEVKEHAEIIISGPDQIVSIDQGFEDKIKDIVGEDLGKVIEVVRLPEKIGLATGSQTHNKAVNIILKQDVNLKEIVTIPLAASINQAIELYKERALEIPQGIRMLLATTFDSEILHNARFVIDNNLSSLPSAINFLQCAFNENHAVTVGNIVVFAKDPGLSAIRFWAHEIQHTVQYKNLGVEDFAAKYPTDYKEMESDAETVASKAVKDAEVILAFVRNKATYSK